MKSLIMNGSIRALKTVALAGLMTLPLVANAGEVRLKSADGTVNLIGEFIDYKDGNYIVRTALGDLRISASRVRCEGDDCPDFETAAADVHFVGSETVGLGILPLLLGGYATYLNAESAVTNTQTENEFLATFVGDYGFGDDMGSYLVTSTSSGTAFDGLMSKEGTIGMSSRRIEPSEARSLRDAGKGNMVSVDQEHLVAVDSLVIIVNPENRIESISIEDLGRVYSGEVTNWNQVGGSDMAIKVVTRQQDTGTFSVFQSKVYGAEAPSVPADAIVASNNNEVAAAVNDNLGAIGFTGYAFQRGAKSLSLINECGITTDPDPFSAKTEEYALQRRLFFYNTQNPSEEIKNLINYATSEDADGVIAKSGFIDLGIIRREQAMDSPRASAMLNADVDAFEGNIIREMLAEMVRSDRLSSTFRFRSGSSQLDERGLLEMKRLANFLEKRRNGTKVTLVGFTDNVGAFEPNRELSINRSSKVLEELMTATGDRLSHIEFATIGFGEIAPSACNGSDTGRNINRRVEIWIEKS